jgi:hypothetical protein
MTVASLAAPAPMIAEATWSRLRVLMPERNSGASLNEAAEAKFADKVTIVAIEAKTSFDDFMMILSV